MKTSGWGRYPWVDCETVAFETHSQIRSRLGQFDSCIPHGQGRSYGDSALGKNLVLTARFDKLLGFDPENGLLTCESGVTLADLIEIFLPRGWFLTVTPGTKFVSVGGAIASDVHGKNHHKTGCFSECVISFLLMLPSGETVQCSRSENPELFLATCGGMGLTGIILEAVIRLLPVKSVYIRETVIRCKNLEEAFDHFENKYSSTYSVAWIDCLAKGKNQGRSVLRLGEHADAGKLHRPATKQIAVPFSSPAFLLNKFTVSMFNYLYYSRQPEFVDGKLTSIDAFFYPLDKVGHWNRMYGANGFTQYQLVLPTEASRQGLRAILNKVSNAGLGSFLAVLKLLGPANRNYLSFPMAGYTLTLDFKIQSKLFTFLDELDRIVLDHGGRLYLTKDVRMSAVVFRDGYPQWEMFAKIRDKYGMRGKFNSLQSKRLGV